MPAQTNDSTKKRTGEIEPSAGHGFVISDEANCGHWRGFSKYVQHDGSLIGYCDIGGNECRILGPFKRVQDLDTAIAGFYFRDTEDE